jgi:hypothetical protein
MKNPFFAVTLIIVIASGLCLVGCPLARTTTSQTASTGATQVTGFVSVPKNSQGHTVEQQNILDRIRVTTDPTKVMWIHMISLDGRIISRMAVRNKVTSSEKRLEPTHAGADSQGRLPKVPGTENWEYGGAIRTDELIQPDGTFGASDQYIFWFDPQGRYHQWGTAGGLGYLLTDYPIDLRNPIDEITGLYNADATAQSWQEQQEVKMGEQEAR